MPRFYAGQPVVCVDARFRSGWWLNVIKRFGVTLPCKGQRYVVRGYVYEDKYPIVVLQEISNPRVPYGDGQMRECGFWEERFQPTTDIADLERCLDRKSMPRRRSTPEWDRTRTPEKVE